MANPSKRIAHTLQRFYFHEIASKPSPHNPISRSPILSSTLSSSSQIWKTSRPNEFISNPTSPNGLISRLLSRNYTSRAHHPNLSTPNPSLAIRPKIGLPYRFLSGKSFRSVKLDAGVAKSVARKPLDAFASAFSRYREAVGLQMDAFWKRNYLILVGAGAVVMCVALWRIMFGIASTFVGLSEGMAKYGFLALAAAMVAFAGMYARSRFTLNPDKIYRMAMTKLNTSAGILEVMGAPLTGTELRAYVMSGGGPRFKNFKMRFGGKRCFLIFPIRGSERRGLVSVEVKKKKGQYDMKLLAVDIPMAAGPDQRLYLIGDEQEYKVGGGLISELRDPIVKAMAAEKEFEELDQKEEEEDEVRELEEAERKQREEKERTLEAEKKRLELESLEKGS